MIDEAIVRNDEWRLGIGTTAEASGDEILDC
jgi:hypothetical protein